MDATDENHKILRKLVGRNSIDQPSVVNNMPYGQLPQWVSSGPSLSYQLNFRFQGIADV